MLYPPSPKGKCTRSPSLLKVWVPASWSLAIRHRGDAFRVVYTLKIDDDLWVVRAFQKKSKTGIKTPQAEIDLIRERLSRIREALK